MKLQSMVRQDFRRIRVATTVAIAAFAISTTLVAAAPVKVTLAGDQEVPAVKSDGAGTGAVTVGADRIVTGSITTTGIQGTAAHIHSGAVDKSGPVVIVLSKSGDTYSVPAGAKLTDAQYAAFMAGDLYVNVHTAAHPDGDIRGQLKP